MRQDALLKNSQGEIFKYSNFLFIFFILLFYYIFCYLSHKKTKRAKRRREKNSFLQIISIIYCLRNYPFLHCLDLTWLWIDFGYMNGSDSTQAIYMFFFTLLIKTITNFSCYFVSNIYLFIFFFLLKDFHAFRFSSVESKLKLKLRLFYEYFNSIINLLFIILETLTFIGE